eukprot:TRINITY_DN5429_c0_g1_i1.p1 TRINITY_DN5429_c0_g1~~TRINITY_DN5429_c0_g1_i1.p1  ORF type:complete len:268 (+),score=76.49 TRINITY_DN5429_c0_g1_i1:233-1036(+)
MPLFGDNKKKAVEAKEKGNKLFAQKKWKEAIEAYNKAIKLDPTEAAFYSNRSAAYMGMGDYNSALKDAEECIKVKSNWAKGYYRKGMALVSLKRLLDSEAAFKEGLQYEPENAEIKKKLEELEPSLAPLRPKFNADGSVMSPSQKLKDEGNAHFKAARYEVAIEYYTKALGCAPDGEEKSVLFTNRATCYAQLHQFTEVVNDCTDALKHNPKNAKALLRRGMAYEALEKWNLGIEDMKATLSIEPGALLASQVLQRLINYKNASAKF